MEIEITEVGCGALAWADVLQRNKDFKGTWMKIIRYCKRYLAVIVVALICAVAGTILTILGPDKLSDLTKVITEGIATGIDMERVKSIGLTLVAFYVASAILSFGQQSLWPRSHKM